MKARTEDSSAWRATLQMLGAGLLPLTTLRGEVWLYGFNLPGFAMSKRLYTGRASREIAAWLKAQAARGDT